MKTKFVLSLFVFCFFFNSCGDESLYEGRGDGTLLKQVLIEGEVYTEHTHNSAGLVIEEKSKYHYSKHTYNSGNKLIQSDYYWDWRIASSSSYVLEEATQRTDWVSPENTEKDGYLEYEYNRNGNLERITSYRLKNDNTSYSTYSYNNQGRIDRSTYFHQDKASGFRKYFYDLNGNLIKEEHYFILEDGLEQLQSTTEYEYDRKRNPYFSFRGLMTPGRNTNPNNILKQTITHHYEVDDFIDQVQITEYSYEYNRKGYPIRRNDSFEYIYY